MYKEKQKHKEKYNNSIDTNLKELEKKINEINKKPWICGYEKDKNWNFYAIYNGNKLDIPIKSPEKLLDVLNLLKNCVETYLKSWYKKEKLYVSKDWFMSWKHFFGKIDFGKIYYDIFVDNRKWVLDSVIWDTTFLTHESIKKIFWHNKDWFYSEKIAEFLNKILNNEENNSNKW